jgi:mycothiol system anti-sigma-R factor
MDTRCDDIATVVHPFLDGELLPADRVALEAHLASCTACRALVADEAAFKAQLKARLGADPAPASLRERVLASLDQADARGQGPVVARPRRFVPIAALVAAAAAMVLFLGSFGRPSTSRAALVDDAIRAHEKNLAPEVRGDSAQVSSFMQGKVDVPVRPPRLSPAQAALVGARIGHVHGRDAAQLMYQVGASHLTVYVFDPDGVAMNAPRRRLAAGRELYVDGARGYSVVFFRDENVGYAFASDLDEATLLDLVSASFGQ